MKVLFVDDEKDILNSIKRQMRKEKFEVILSNSAENALELLKTDNYEIVVSDERMPGISGVDFLKEVKELYPETIRIILSGYADSKTIIDAINKGEIYRFIPKPWNIDDLKATIYKAIEKWEIEEKNKIYMKEILEENIRLKEELNSRESKLHLKREILDHLEVPILLINKDYSVEYFNRPFIEKVDKKITIGINVVDYLSLKSVEVLSGLLKFESLVNKVNYKIKDKDINIVGRGFRPSDDYLGILIFEEG